MVAGPGCDPGISGFNSRTTLASVAEWFIAAACKAAVLTGIGGSNPSRRTLPAADSAAVFPKDGCPVRLRVEVLVSRRAKSTWPYRVPSVTFKETRRPTTLAYLAGLLEGEGSFLRPPPSTPQQSAVALAMTDEDVVSRAAMLLETSRQAPPYRRAVHHKPVYTARFRGLRAVEVMQALYPMMGARRQRQIDEAFAARSIKTFGFHMSPKWPKWWTSRRMACRVANSHSAMKSTPRRLIGLWGGYGRRDEALAQAARIEAAESHLAAMIGDNPELAWLAGIVEGEGALGADVSLRVHMADEDVMRRVAALFGVSLHFERPRRANWLPTWRAGISGESAVLLLGQMEGTVGQRRRQQVQAMRATLADRRSRNGVRESAAGNRRGFVPPSRMARNLEIAADWPPVKPARLWPQSTG
jgi:hypothetical protein